MRGPCPSSLLFDAGRVLTENPPTFLKGTSPRDALLFP